MRLFENSIVYAPEQEGGTGSSGNTASQSELSPEELAELQADLETVTDESSSTTEGGSELDLELLSSELDNLATQRIEASKPEFEVNEDGLSLQGAEIQDIKSQIQQLESGQGEAFDAIQNEILQSRQESRIILEDKKIKLEGIQLQLLGMIERAYNNLKASNPNSTESIEEFTEKARGQEKFGKAITDNESALAQVAQDLQTFDQETENQVQAAIQTRLEELNTQLTEAQASYTETGAEENDKPILLERAKGELEKRLSETEFTREVQGIIEFDISDRDLQEIFELYGYVDGMERIKKLKVDSDVYNGSESTEQSIQHFAGIAKERELNLLRDSKNTLEQEVGGIEGDPSYQEASHLERDRSSDNLNLDLLSKELETVTCEVRLTGKGFELQEDYQKTLEELSSKVEVSSTSLNTELDRLGSAISNIRALRNFRMPEGKNMKVGELREIEDYLEQNKSKSRWNPSKDQDAISRLSPILENIKLRITERDNYISQYHTINSESSINRFGVDELNRKYNQNEYIRDKLGQIELTDKNSIIQAINQLKGYIEQYQKPDDFDTKQLRLRELEKEIDTLSKQENDLRQYNPNVIYT
jgi:hypothetical protein